MPQNLLAIHGVIGLVVCVGAEGRIMHFAGDIYQPREVESPTQATLRGVWVTSPEDAWAAGDGELLRWDGRAWHRMGLNVKHEGFGAIWGDPSDGSVWIGSKTSLLRYRTDGSGGTMSSTELAIRAIWGTGSDDIFYVCCERSLMHWKGSYELRRGKCKHQWAVEFKRAADAGGPPQPEPVKVPRFTIIVLFANVRRNVNVIFYRSLHSSLCEQALYRGGRYLASLQQVPQVDGGCAPPWPVLTILATGFVACDPSLRPCGASPRRRLALGGPGVGFPSWVAPCSSEG